MSRVSRRKTLSHSEIENFLSEINVEQKQCISKDTNQFIDGHSSLAVVPSLDPMRTEVQSIRDFCKATFHVYRQGKPLEPTRELCNIGRDILTGSSYPILSTRLLRPENYLYPSSSLEGKKSLLLSLSPMLSDAEEQRQKETAACENFTRCTSGKGKGKYSCYVYTDKDVKCQVDFPEYEKRYMLYIGQNKKTYAKVTPMSPSLNYLTLQHRQRVRAERMSTSTSMSVVPKRNLQSILDGQMGEENCRISNSPNQNVVKLFNKPKIEPVKLDESTMELVNALRKSRRASSEFSVASMGTNATVESNSSVTSETLSVSSSCVSAGSTPAKRSEEPIRSPFAALCETTASVVGTTTDTITTAATTTFMNETIHVETTTDLTNAVVEDLVPMDVDANDGDSEDGSSLAGFNDRKRKHGRGGRLLARRGTLSPASVRAMLLEVCDPDPHSDGGILGDPFAAMSTVTHTETVGEEGYSEQEQSVTTPTKTSPVSTVNSAFDMSGSVNFCSSPIEAAPTSPFSIRTALELRRSPPKSPPASPSTTSSGLVVSSSPSLVTTLVEVTQMEITEDAMDVQFSDVEHHAQGQQRDDGGEHQHDVEQEQEQEMKKARSGSPSSSSTRNLASSPIISPVAASLQTTVSPAVSVYFSPTPSMASPQHSPSLLSAAAVATDAMPSLNESVYPPSSHVEGSEADIRVEDSDASLSSAETDGFLTLTDSELTHSVTHSEFSAAEMEVIEDFGRELDGLLCDTSVVHQDYSSSSRIHSATKSATKSSLDSSASDCSGDVSSWTTSHTDADEAFILSAPASPMTPQAADSVQVALSSPRSVPHYHLCEETRNAVKEKEEEVEMDQAVAVMIMSSPAALISPSAEPLEGSKTIIETDAMSVPENNTVLVPVDVVVSGCEESEMESVAEEDSAFSFIDQVVETDTVNNIPSTPVLTTTSASATECSSRDVSMISCSKTNIQSPVLAVSVRETELDVVAASAPSPVPVVSLPRLASRIRTPILSGSPSLQLPAFAARSPSALAQASPIASLSTPSGKSNYSTARSSVTKTPQSQQRLHQEPSSQSHHACMPPTPPSVPRAPSAALSPKVAAYFSPFATSNTPTPAVGTTCAVNFGDSSNNGDQSGSRLSARISAACTPASHNSKPVRSPYSCTSSPANSAYSGYSPRSGQDQDNSMDDSVLLFRYDEQNEEDDLQTFEMLESMVQREYCDASSALVANDVNEGEWSLNALTEADTLPLTAHSTESSPASVNKSTHAESREDTQGPPVEGVHQPSSPSRSPANSIAAEVTTASIAMTATPHPRTPQKKTPEQRSAGSSERKRRGLTFIPRYAVSPAAVATASSVTSSSIVSRSGGSREHGKSVDECVSNVNVSVLDDPLDISSCTALASADCEVSLTEIEPAVEIIMHATGTASSALSAEEDVYPEPFDLAAAQAAAKERYDARMLEARWKYEWELASAHMTHAVIQKHQK